MNTVDRIVCVARIRPVLDDIDKLDTERVIHTPASNAEISDNHLIVAASNNLHPVKNFKLDNIFDVEAGQDDVFQGAVEPLLVGAIDDGYNVCICTYGQTGSGKTHTMLGIDLWSLAEDQGFELAIESLELEHIKEFGIVPRSLAYLFNHDNVLSVSVSYIEIFNEKIYDLLDNTEDTRTGNEIREGKPPPRHDLDIRDGSKKAGVIIPNLTCVDVSSLSQAFQVLCVGAKNRSIAATNANEHSSRSHTIFTICVDAVKVVINKGKGGESKTIMKTSSKISLVDLAGSEKWSSSQLAKLESGRVKESIAINKSLSALGKCVAALSSQAQGNKNIHVPYRDSKLTRYLQDSLGGNSRTLFCVTLNPTYGCIEESVSTLQFADRAMKVQVHAIANCIRSHSTKGDSDGDNSITNEQLRRENNVLLYILKSLSIRYTENEIKESIAASLRVISSEDDNDLDVDSLEKNILHKLGTARDEDSAGSMGYDSHINVFEISDTDVVSNEAALSASDSSVSHDVGSKPADSNLVGEFFKRMTKMESSLNSQTEQFSQTRQLFKETNDDLKAELTKANNDLEALRISKESDNKIIKDLRMNLRIEKNKNADLSKELQQLKEVSRRSGRMSLAVSKPPIPTFSTASPSNVRSAERKTDNTSGSVNDSTKSTLVQKPVMVKREKSTSIKSMTDAFSDEMNLLKGLELPQTDRMKRFSVGSVDIMPKLRQFQIPTTRKTTTTIAVDQKNGASTDEDTNNPSIQPLKDSRGDNVLDSDIDLIEKLTLPCSSYKDIGADAYNGNLNDDEGRIDNECHHDKNDDDDEIDANESILDNLESIQLPPQNWVEHVKNDAHNYECDSNNRKNKKVTSKPLWKDAVDQKSGRTYYYNRITKVSQWIRPSEYEMDMLKVVNGKIVVIDEDGGLSCVENEDGT